MMAQLTNHSSSYSTVTVTLNSSTGRSRRLPPLRPEAQGLWSSHTPTCNDFPAGTKQYQTAFKLSFPWHRAHLCAAPRPGGACATTFE
eukprot:3761449-Rhodomonas_salina.1